MSRHNSLTLKYLTEKDTIYYPYGITQRKKIYNIESKGVYVRCIHFPGRIVLESINYSDPSIRRLLSHPYTSISIPRPRLRSHITLTETKDNNEEKNN